MKFTPFHKTNLVKLIKKLNPEFDEQTCDFQALWNSELNAHENYSNILATLNIDYAVKDLDLKGLEEESHRKGIELEEEHTQTEFNKELQSIASEEHPQIDKFFETTYGYLNTIIKGKTKCLVIKSEGGLGKTYNVCKYLTKKGVDFKYISGWITKLELFNFLYENKDKLLIFDDCEIMLEDDGIVALLKPAIWETIKNKRIISYISTSEKLKVPQQFVFEGKLVILLNEVPEEDRATTRALLSRAIYYELHFNYREKIRLMQEIAKLPYENLSKEERFEVISFIKENTDETFEELNLRTLIKGFDLRTTNPTKWKHLLGFLLKQNFDLKAVKEAIRMCPRVNEQVDYFKENTSRSRRTFFRLKKKLESECQNAKQ